MRLSRSDLLPMLTIMAGGVIGASLSFSLLGSRSGDVPVAVGTVTGQVTDAQTGGSVAAVQVYITSLELGGLSQPNGLYVLQNVPAGTYTLTATRIGYRTTEAQITIGGGQTVEQNFSVAEDGANQELTGTWVLSVDLGRQGGGDATFVLEQDGTRISGTYSGLWGTRLKVRGTVEDGLVKFSFVSTRGVVVYEGTLEGTTLKGRCVYGQLDPGTFAGSHRS